LQKRFFSNSDIPVTSLFTYGAALVLNGIDHDRFSQDDFAGIIDNDN